MRKSDGRLRVGMLLNDLGNQLFEIDSVLGTYLLGVALIVAMGNDKIMLDENGRIAQIGYDYMDKLGITDELMEGELIDALHTLEELKKEL